MDLSKEVKYREYVYEYVEGDQAASSAHANPLCTVEINLTDREKSQIATSTLVSILGIQISCTRARSRVSKESETYGQYCQGMTTGMAKE